jgi:GNAT superfamily N-acetyltransferase
VSDDTHSGEQLETGYELTTPIGDNLAGDFARHQVASLVELATHAGWAHQHDDELGLGMIDAQLPMPFLNTVVLLRPLTERAVPAFVARVHQFFGARPGGPVSVWSVWPTPDLGGHGFGLGGHPPLMLRPAAAAPPAAPSELRIAAVGDAETAFAYETALIDGFPVPPMQPVQRGCFFGGESLHAPSWHHFVGYVDDVPVATASGIAGATHTRVDNVATLASHRGRGYGAALTWAATLVQPELPALLYASDDGRPVYERMGYLPITRGTLWLGDRRR